MESERRAKLLQTLFGRGTTGFVGEAPAASVWLTISRVSRVLCHLRTCIPHGMLQQSSIACFQQAAVLRKVPVFGAKYVKDTHCCFVKVWTQCQPSYKRPQCSSKSSVLHVAVHMRFPRKYSYGGIRKTRAWVQRLQIPKDSYACQPSCRNRLVTIPVQMLLQFPPERIKKKRLHLKDCVILCRSGHQHSFVLTSIPAI